MIRRFFVQCWQDALNLRADLRRVGDEFTKHRAERKSRRSMLQRLSDVEVITGPHKGLRGKVVSTPWLGNLWHTWVSINVPMNETEVRQQYGSAYGAAIEELVADTCNNTGPRTWITVRASECKQLNMEQSNACATPNAPFKTQS